MTFAKGDSISDKTL